MKKFENITLNIKGNLMNLGIPKVMGILNVTPDSFYKESRSINQENIRKRVQKMISEGVDIIDLGGCSTRPGYFAPTIQEEWERVNLGCGIIREIAPDVPVSIDTFRADVAQKAINVWKIDIINDISGGADPDMWNVLAESHVCYVLTHNRKEENVNYKDVTANVITDLSKKVNELHKIGINDIIIDPGFGFAKTISENFTIFNNLEEFSRIGLPLLIGISRKSMIYKTLNCGPEESLTGTIALNAIALEKGANILRVHDVKEAKETIKLYSYINQLTDD